MSETLRVKKSKLSKEEKDYINLLINLHYEDAEENFIDFLTDDFDVNYHELAQLETRMEWREYLDTHHNNKKAKEQFKEYSFYAMLQLDAHINQ